MPRPEKRIRAANAHGNDGHAEFLRQIENPFFEIMRVAVAGTPGLGKSDQAHSGIQSRFCALGHGFQSRAGGLVRHRNVAESTHHPTVYGDLEMRLQLESAQKLWNSRVHHKRIENIHVIAYENACARGIKPRRAVHLELHTDQPQNISKKQSLRPVVFSRVDDDGQKNQEYAYHRKMNSADGPQYERADREIRFSHTMASNAPGRISSERHSRFRISPSLITLTGPSRRNSTRFAAAREASGCSMCFPVKSPGKFFSKLSRLTGAQRTYSIKPSVGSAFGAIIIFPPVNLLLLKERNSAGS